MAKPKYPDPYAAAATPVSSVHKDEQREARRRRKKLAARTKGKPPPRVKVYGPEFTPEIKKALKPVKVPKKVKKESAKLLAADLTPLLGDVIDSTKKKPPPKLKDQDWYKLLQANLKPSAPYRKGKKLVTLAEVQQREEAQPILIPGTKGQPDRVYWPKTDAKTKTEQDEFERKLRLRAADLAPVNEDARKYLRKTRDPNLPDILRPQPGKGETAAQRMARLKAEARDESWFSKHSGLDEVKDAISDGLDAFGAVEDFTSRIEGKTLGTGADFLLSPEERKTLLEDLVVPAMESTGRWAEKLGHGLDVAGGAVQEAVSDLTRGLKPPKTGRAFKSTGQQEMSALPAEVIQHSAKVLRNSVVGLSQVTLGMAPGIVYGILDPEGIARATAEQYKLYYGPLLDGDFQKFLKNVEDFPLQIPLDVLAVLQVFVGMAARVSAVSRNIRLVGGKVMMETASGELRPITRTEAIIQGAALKKSPVDVFNDPNRMRWGRNPIVRHTKKKTRRPEAGEESVVALISEDMTRSIGVKRLSRPLSAKKHGMVGLRAADDQGVRNKIEWQGETWIVEGIYDQVPRVQRFAPHSEIGVFLTDIYHERLRPKSWGFRQQQRNVIEQNRAIIFSQYQTAKHQARWVNRGKTFREKRARQHAWDRMMVYGSYAKTELRKEIALRQNRPEVYQLTPEARGELKDLQRALVLVDDPPPQLTQAVEAMGALADKTQDILVRAGHLHPETARKAIVANFAWLMDEGPIKGGGPVRDAIERSLFAISNDPYEAALGMHYYDSTARRWAAETGLPPEEFYPVTFGGAFVTDDAKLLMISPDTAAYGMLHQHIEEELAIQDKYEADTGKPYPLPAEVQGQSGVSRWDAARNRALATEYGAFTDDTPVAQLLANGYRLFVSDSNDVTFSIAPDGDIAHITNTSDAPRAFESAIFMAINQGGRTLDVYASHVNPAVWEKYGFHTVAHNDFDPAHAPANWDYDKFGQPDILHKAFMPWVEPGEIYSTHFPDHYDAKHFTLSLTTGQDGRIWYRQFYSKLVDTLKGLDNKLEIKSVISQLEKRGVSPKEIEFFKLEEFLAQLPGKSINRDELVSQFSKGWEVEDVLPARLYEHYEEGMGHETHTLPGGRESIGTIVIHSKALTEAEYTDFWNTPEGERILAERGQETPTEALEIEARRDEWIALRDRNDERRRAEEEERRRHEPWDDEAELTDEEIQRGIEEMEAWEDRQEGDRMMEEFYEGQIEQAHKQPPPEVLVYSAPQEHFPTEFGFPPEARANAMGHLRFSVRSIQGRKTLVIEEIQSDWANAIREWKEAKAEEQKWMADNPGAEIPEDYEMPPEPPPMPYGSQAWPLRLIKEAMSYAADNGIERVAWTTGKQQADRWSQWVQKNVQRIDVEQQTLHSHHDTDYKIILTKHNGQKVDKIITGRREVKKAIGSSMAEDIFSQIDADPLVDFAKGFVEGENMHVGYGVARFYDENIPKMIQAYLKKEGVKFETAFLDKLPIEVTYIDGNWWAKGTTNDPRVRTSGVRVGTNPPIDHYRGEFLPSGGASYMPDIHSASKEAVIYASRNGGIPRTVKQVTEPGVMKEGTRGTQDEIRKLEIERVRLNNKAHALRESDPDMSDGLYEEAEAINKQMIAKLGEVVKGESKPFTYTDEIYGKEHVGKWVFTHPDESSPPPQGPFFASREEAVAALDAQYRPFNDPTMNIRRDQGTMLADVSNLELAYIDDVAVPYFDMTAAIIEKAQKQSLFRRDVPGAPIALLQHLPYPEPPRLHFGHRSDLATYVHELVHGILPQYLSEMVKTGDPRYEKFKAHFEFTGLNLQHDQPLIPVVAEEAIARSVELMLYDAVTNNAHMRDMLKAASKSVRKTYNKHDPTHPVAEPGVPRMGFSPHELEKAEGAMADIEIYSVLNEMFDFARGVKVAPDAHFITRSRYYGIGYQGKRARDFVKASLVGEGRVKTPVKKGLTMQAVKSGEYQAGTRPTEIYAVESIRLEASMQAGRDVTKKATRIPLDDDGYPVVDPDYAFWRPGETHTTQSQQAAVMGMMEENGFDVTNYEPQELAEIMHDVTGAVSVQQTGGRDARGHLPSWEGFARTNKMSHEMVVQEIREGKILQAPQDSIHAYLDATVGAWTLDSIGGGVTQAFKTIFMIPNELAKWRMITKPAYTILNTANASILGVLTQGVFHPWNMRVAVDRLGAREMTVLHYFDALVGGGSAELGRLSDIRPRGAAEAVFRGNQLAFQKILNAVSTPERRIRRTAIEHEFRRYGLHSDEDILEFKLLAETDPVLKERELAMGRAAEEAMIRFRGMRPGEQNLVRNFLFVYGWLRAATRFTLRYPIEHPLMARTLAWAGDYGWDEVRKLFWTVPWRYSGGMPTNLSVEDNKAMIQMLDLNPLMPQSTASELMRAMWNVGADQNVSKDTLSDLLAPGAELGLSVFFGEDNWGNTVLDQIKDNYMSWEILPGVMWAMRFADPGSTETNLRAPTDRMGVLMMFLFGQTAPQTYKAEEMYQRWLQDLPTPVARVIQHQQDAANLQMVGDKAYEEIGGMPRSISLAIEASEAFAVGRGYSLAFVKDQQKKNDPHGPEVTELPAAYASGAKLKILEKLYPDAAFEVEEMISSYGYDRKNKDDWPGINTLIDSRWRGLVEGPMSALRGLLRAKKMKIPAAESYLWGAVPDKSAAPAYQQFQP